MSKQSQLNKKILESCKHFFGTLVSFVPYLLFYNLNRILLSRYCNRAFHYKNKPLENINKHQFALKFQSKPLHQVLKKDSKENEDPNTILISQNNNVWKYFKIDKNGTKHQGDLSNLKISKAVFIELTFKKNNASQTTQQAVIKAIQKKEEESSLTNKPKFGAPIFNLIKYLYTVLGNIFSRIKNWFTKTNANNINLNANQWKLKFTKQPNKSNVIYLFKNNKEWSYLRISEDEDQKEQAGKLSELEISKELLNKLNKIGENIPYAERIEIIEAIQKKHKPKKSKYDLYLDIPPLNIFKYFYSFGSFIGTIIGSVTFALLCPFNFIANKIFGEESINSVKKSLINLFALCNNAFKKICHLILPKLFHEYTVLFVYSMLYSSYVLLGQAILNFGASIFIGENGLHPDYPSRLKEPEKTKELTDRFLQKNYFPGYFSKEKIDAALDKKIEQLGENYYYNDHNVITNPSSQPSIFDKITKFYKTIGENQGEGMRKGINNSAEFIKKSSSHKPPIWHEEDKQNDKKEQTIHAKSRLVPFYDLIPNSKNLPQIDEKKRQEKIIRKIIAKFRNQDKLSINATKHNLDTLINYYKTLNNINIRLKEIAQQLESSIKNPKTNEKINLIKTRYFSKRKLLETSKKNVITSTLKSIFFKPKKQIGNTKNPSTKAKNKKKESSLIFKPSKNMLTLLKEVTFELDLEKQNHRKQVKELQVIRSSSMQVKPSAKSK